MATIKVTTSNGLVPQNLRTLVDAQRIADGLRPIPGYAKLKRLVGNVATVVNIIILFAPSITNPAFELAGNEPSPFWNKEEGKRLEETWILSKVNTSNAIVNVEVDF